MEKIKKFVKKNQILLIAVCVCIAALTVAFFAGGNRSENKVQTASTASSLSTTNADTETTSVSATEKTTQNPTDSAKSNIKRTEKIPKIKRTVRIIRRTVTVQPLKKVKNPSRVQATVLRIRKNRLLHQTVLQNRTKRTMFSRQHRISTKPILYRRESQSRLNRKNRKQKIQIFIVPLQSPVQQFLTI